MDASAPVPEWFINFAWGFFIAWLIQNIRITSLKVRVTRNMQEYMNSSQALVGRLVDIIKAMDPSAEQLFRLDRLVKSFGPEHTKDTKDNNEKDTKQ